jgi:hypothetical protein
MKSTIKYVGMDVHQSTISVAVLDAEGRPEAKRSGHPRRAEVEKHRAAKRFREVAFALQNQEVEQQKRGLSDMSIKTDGNQHKGGCAAQEPMCGPANHRNGWLLTQLTASARNRDDWHSDSLVSPVKSRCDAAVKTQHFSSCFLSCL